MDYDGNQYKIGTGCKLVNEALARFEEEWNQHVSLIQNSIVDICSRELRQVNSEIPHHLATPSSKRRKKRFTSAQNALQALLNQAHLSKVNSSPAGLKRPVTRALAKKGSQDNFKSNESKHGSCSSNTSTITENKGRGRRVKATAKTVDKHDDVFSKPEEPEKKEKDKKLVNCGREKGEGKDCDPNLKEFVKEPEILLQRLSPEDLKKYGGQASVAHSLISEDLSISYNNKSPEEGKDANSSKGFSSEKKSDNSSTELADLSGEVDEEPLHAKGKSRNLEESQKKGKKTNKSGQARETAKDIELLTDDEEAYESADSVGDDTFSRMTRKKSSNSSKKFSTVKKKKRKHSQYNSQYYTPSTPSIPYKSARLTRATARLAATPLSGNVAKNNLSKTVQNSIKSAQKLTFHDSNKNSVTTSGSSIASSGTTVCSMVRSASAKSKTAVPRTCATPDSKTLTASAAKRRLAEEERKKQQLAQLRKKEEKAQQMRQKNLMEKALYTKSKNEEKKKKIELAKELRERELEEKRLKELAKDQEIERRRREKEETRRKEAQQHQENLKKKQYEFEFRKQQEEEERKARLLRQQEEHRKKQEEVERNRLQQEKLLHMIQQHNTNLQKQTANNLLPKSLTNNQHAPQFKAPPAPPPVVPEAQASASGLNRTYSVDEENIARPEVTPQLTETYDMTPPPKPKQSFDSYDISNIKPDDDTDDEEQPKKRIPNWARGDKFGEALDKQFAKPRKLRENDIRSIFPRFDLLVRLDEIFSQDNPVHPKYDKRTSSAIWNSPPDNSTFNYSVLSDIYQ